MRGSRSEPCPGAVADSLWRLAGVAQAAHSGGAGAGAGGIGGQRRADPTVREIGTDILARQARDDCGARVIDRLSDDLRVEFPDMKGSSRRNLKYMRDFAAAYPASAIMQQPAAQVPWFHIVALITKLDTLALREWYAREALARPRSLRREARA